MALEYASKTNNKHTCQILAAVVKCIWLLLREPEHMHNYVKILIGFQQPSYPTWICMGTGLPTTGRAASSGRPYAAAPAARPSPGWWAQAGQDPAPRTVGAEPSNGAASATDGAVRGRSARRLCRGLDDPRCRAPRTLRGVQSAGQRRSALAYTAIKHRNRNLWLWNRNTDKPDIKQLKTLKTKDQKLRLKPNHPGHADFGDLSSFYLTLNSELMKTSRLVVLEHETLRRQENLTGGTRAACLRLISFPAPVLGRPPLRRRTSPQPLRPDREYHSSSDSASAAPALLKKLDWDYPVVSQRPKTTDYSSVVTWAEF